MLSHGRKICQISRYFYERLSSFRFLIIVIVGVALVVLGVLSCFGAKTFPSLVSSWQLDGLRDIALRFFPGPAIS